MSFRRCVSVSAVELATGGSATNGATPSSILMCPWIKAVVVVAHVQASLAQWTNSGEHWKLRSGQNKSFCFAALDISKGCQGIVVLRLESHPGGQLWTLWLLIIWDYHHPAVAFRNGICVKLYTILKCVIVWHSSNKNSLNIFSLLR